MFRSLLLAFTALSLAAGVSAQGLFPEKYEALREAKRVYELTEERLPKSDTEIASVTLDYGESLLRAFELKESRKILKLALKRYKALHGKDSLELIPVLLLLAQADASYPQLRPNHRYLKQARKIATNKLDITSIEYADHMLAIGQVTLFRSPPDVAGEDLRSAYQIYVSKLEPAAIRIGEAELALGRYFLGRKEYDEAMPHLQSALRTFDPSVAERLERHIEVRALWGGTLQSYGLRDEATVHYVAVGRLLESSAGEELLPLFRVAPVYPADALRAGISGYVDWQYTVDESGYVVDPEVVHTEGSKSFEKASLGALLNFRYPPRFIDGEAVATPGVTNRISFVIQD